MFFSGPYAADKAAFSLLTKLEKLKIKVPYERHFLLLCLCTTVFVKIRGFADCMFSKVEDDWEKIKKFSTHKVLRFAEILEKFQPPDVKSISSKDSSNNKAVSETDSCVNRKDSVNRMLKEIDKCDFTALGNKIQDRVNIYESNLKDIDEIPTDSDVCVDNKLENFVSGNDSKQNSDSGSNSIKKLTDVGISDVDSTRIDELQVTTHKQDTNIPSTDGQTAAADINKTDSAKPDSKVPELYSKGLMLLPRRTGHRTRGRSRMQRNNTARLLQMQQNPDALCGVVYMKDALIAKIMFMIIVVSKLINTSGQY